MLIYLVEANLVNIPDAKSMDVRILHILYIYFAAKVQRNLVLCK